MANKTTGTFVLVPGAWCGGWIYDQLAEILRRRGHRVFAPTLAGLAERADELSGAIDLDAHVADVVGLIEREGLRDIVLAGHSYGGMVISGVAARVPEGIIHAIVYLDAFFPESGQSMVDLIGPEAARAVYGDADPLPFPPMIAEGDPGMQAVVDRLTPHPRKTKFQRLGDISARENIATKIFVQATRATGGWHEATIRELRERTGWKVVTIDTGHNLMTEDPQETARILEEAI